MKKQRGYLQHHPRKVEEVQVPQVRDISGAVRVFLLSVVVVSIVLVLGLIGWMLRGPGA